MSGSRQFRKAYILMEVMLAAGIFAMAGVGLAVALNNIAKTHIQSRKLSAIRMELDSRLTESRIKPVAAGKETDKPNSSGITYEKEIAPMEFRRLDRKSAGSKIPLRGIFRVTIYARWLEGAEPQNEKAEIYVYQP